MDRFFCMLALSLCLLLTPAPGFPAKHGARSGQQAETVLFSMIFPQLIPPDWLEGKHVRESGAQML